MKAILNSVIFTVFTFVMLTIISLIFEEDFTDVALMFLIAQGASIVVHIGILNDKIDEKGRE